MYISVYRQHFLQRCRASMTQHRQQSTRVRAKEIDPIWSQVCSLIQRPIQIEKPMPPKLRMLPKKKKVKNVTKKMVKYTVIVEFVIYSLNKR